MNILQLISSKGFFGAENVLLQLSNEIKKRKSDRVVVGCLENSYSPHLEVIERCQKSGIETAIFPCRGKFDVRVMLQIRRLIREKKIDIIHSHGYKANFYSVFASIGFKISLIATCHNWLGNDYKMKFYATLDRFLLRKFNKIVVVSDDLKKLIISSGISHRKVRIVRNGISLDSFQASGSATQMKIDLGIPPKSSVIGTVGRISEEKGHRYLLRSAETIIEQYPGSVFLIIGDGPLRETLQKEFNRSFIKFTGMRDDLPELYQCMDIFVLPSLTEGLPLVLLEAMASKLPVVATRVGAVPSVIIDKENGFLVEPGDGEGIKNYLLYLLRDCQAGKLMGQKGYQIVKENYSSERMAKEYMEIYKDLVIQGANKCS